MWLSSNTHSNHDKDIRQTQTGGSVKDAWPVLPKTSKVTSNKESARNSPSQRKLRICEDLMEQGSLARVLGQREDMNGRTGGRHPNKVRWLVDCSALVSIS